MYCLCLLFAEELTGDTENFVMECDVRHYDIRDTLQALQFVSILPRLARHDLGLRRPLEERFAMIDVKQFESKPWSKSSQRQEDERLATAKQTRDLE
jgi:hypothetical protein